MLLGQQDRKPATGRITGNTRAIDATADDGQIEVSHLCFR